MVNRSFGYFMGRPLNMVAAETSDDRHHERDGFEPFRVLPLSFLIPFLFPRPLQHIARVGSYPSFPKHKRTNRTPASECF